MKWDRRSVLSAFGLGLPLGLGRYVEAAPAPNGPTPTLRFRSFEEAVSAAFGRAPGERATDASADCWRIEVGPSDLVRIGVQGCHNDRPFAGFPAGALRIVRSGCEPGPVWRGARLYVSTVDVALTATLDPRTTSRPLDFSTLPAAPMLV